MPYSQAFIVDEEESAAPAIVEMRDEDRSAQGSAELVLLISRPDAVKEVPPIQLVVAQELVHVSVKLVGSRFDAGVENRPVSSAELCAVGVRLHFEFLQGVHGRLNDVTGVIQKIGEVGIVVDAVQQDIVLIRTAPIRTESVTPGVARSRLAGSHAGAELGELRKVPPIERQVHDTAVIHHLAEL